MSFFRIKLTDFGSPHVKPIYSFIWSTYFQSFASILRTCTLLLVKLIWHQENQIQFLRYLLSHYKLVLMTLYGAGIAKCHQGGHEGFAYTLILIRFRYSFWVRYLLSFAKKHQQFCVAGIDDSASFSIADYNRNRSIYFFTSATQNCSCDLSFSIALLTLSLLIYETENRKANIAKQCRRGHGYL